VVVGLAFDKAIEALVSRATGSQAKVKSNSKNQKSEKTEWVVLWWLLQPIQNCSFSDMRKMSYIHRACGFTQNGSLILP
jgi:hypothetical protein